MVILHGAPSLVLPHVSAPYQPASSGRSGQVGKPNGRGLVSGATPEGISETLGVHDALPPCRHRPG
jgi:hypothetical protein